MDNVAERIVVVNDGHLSQEDLVRVTEAAAEKGVEIVITDTPPRYEDVDMEAAVGLQALCQDADLRERARDNFPDLVRPRRRRPQTFVYRPSPPGHPAFMGEKTVQRVGMKAPGRNEPCPCGSEKKYKKCCNK